MTDSLDMPALLDALARHTTRPRYSFMVINLIWQASGQTGRAGPTVRSGDKHIPLRDWLCDALTAMGRRDPRRLRLVERVREELSNRLPSEHAQAETAIEKEVTARVRESGKTNVSRAVTELVKAGLLNRHYQGYRVDHVNRGAQRHAIYELPPPVIAALAARPAQAA